MNYRQLLSQRIQQVPPSGIRKFFDIVSDMKDAISLGVGEPDFVTPWNIREACIYSLEKGHTHYTSNWGLLELREEIAQYLEHRFSTSYDPASEIVVTVGASEAIDLALRCLLEPGDEVLVPEPSYVSYMPNVVFAGGEAVGITTKAEEQFRLKPEALLVKITPKTKALILPYPNNPTGAIMERADLEVIAEALQGTDILVVSDEIYAELSYHGKHVSFASLPGMRERTIVINGFSKAFAMTGWRLGYAAGPEEIIQTMVKIHQYTMLCAPIMSQMAGLEALKSGFADGYSQVEKMAKQYNQRRRIIVEAFNGFGMDCFEPLGAFYCFPSIQRTGMTSEEFCEALLAEQKVAVVPGTAFGPSGEGFVRCSYASSIEKIQEAIKRIKAFMEHHINA